VAVKVPVLQDPHVTAIRRWDQLALLHDGGEPGACDTKRGSFTGQHVRGPRYTALYHHAPPFAPPVHGPVARFLCQQQPRAKMQRPSGNSGSHGSDL